MSEVKRYKYGYRDDGNGQRFLGLIESPSEERERVMAERDTLRKQLDEAKEHLVQYSSYVIGTRTKEEIDEWLERNNK